MLFANAPCSLSTCKVHQVPGKSVLHGLREGVDAVQEGHDFVALGGQVCEARATGAFALPGHQPLQPLPAQAVLLEPAGESEAYLQGGAAFKVPAQAKQGVLCAGQAPVLRPFCD